MMSLAAFAAAYLWFALTISTLFLATGFCLDSGIREAVKNFRQATDKARAASWQSDFSQLRESLSDLIRSGFRAASLSVRARAKSSKFSLEFKKYIRAPGDYGVELVFPLYKWAQPFAEGIKSYCRDKNLPLRVRSKRTPRSREVIFVDCGNESAVAFDLARHLWIKIFGQEETTAHRVDRYAVSSLGELIDRPDQTPMSVYNDNRHPSDQGEGLNLLRCLASAGWTFSFPVIFVCLIVTASNSLAMTPDWAITLADQEFSGSTSSLAFFLLYLLFVAVRLLRRREKKEIATLPPWFITLLKGWGRLTRLTLPLAVLLIWSGA